MANKVFISFRFADGKSYKDQLVEKFEELDYTINKSEDEDRSEQSESTIQKYLYEKLADTSLTVVILTPEAIEYHRSQNKIDDWLYDELRYSLEDREGNRTNGAIALYTPDAKSFVIVSETEEVITIADFENLVRKNMLNVKPDYKYCPTEGRWNSMKDSYISLVSFDKFMNSPKQYIDSALEKRDRIGEFDLVKRM
ncbi:TIR domain-containing protein [Lactovum odontotermitis]